MNFFESGNDLSHFQPQPNAWNNDGLGSNAADKLKNSDVISKLKKNLISLLLTLDKVQNLTLAVETAPGFTPSTSWHAVTAINLQVTGSDPATSFCSYVGGDHIMKILHYHWLPRRACRQWGMSPWLPLYRLPNQHPIFSSTHCNSYNYQVRISGYPIFIWIAVTWQVLQGIGTVTPAMTARRYSPLSTTETYSSRVQAMRGRPEAQPCAVTHGISPPVGLRVR